MKHIFFIKSSIFTLLGLSLFVPLSIAQNNPSSIESDSAKLKEENFQVTFILPFSGNAQPFSCEPSGRDNSYLRCELGSFQIDKRKFYSSENLSVQLTEINNVPTLFFMINKGKSLAFQDISDINFQIQNQELVLQAQLVEQQQNSGATDQSSVPTLTPAEMILGKWLMLDEDTGILYFNFEEDLELQVGRDNSTIFVGSTYELNPVPNTNLYKLRINTPRQTWLETYAEITKEDNQEVLKIELIDVPYETPPRDNPTELNEKIVRTFSRGNS